MPFYSAEFGLLLTSVLPIVWRLRRFNGLHMTLHLMSNYHLCGFWIRNHVPLRFGISLARDPIRGLIGQPPAATSFQSRGSRNAQPGPRVGHGTGNLRRSCFCARVSSNLPRIEDPR